MSTAAILAPRSLRARIACVITLTWVLTGLVPQITTRSDTAHLARIDAGDLAGADGKADAGDVGADRRIEARIFLHMRQAIDAVAHHEPHGAGVVIGPDRLRAEFALGRIEALGDLVQRLVPGNPRELAGALRPGPAQRMHQPVGMMDALGVARDLGADDAGRVGLQLRAAHPADACEPSITSTSSAQADGQSCGQVECRISILACWFMA